MGMSFHNDARIRVLLALMWSDPQTCSESDLGTNLKMDGWTILDQGETREVFRGRLRSGSFLTPYEYYFWARKDDNTLKWEGDGSRIVHGVPPDRPFEYCIGLQRTPIPSWYLTLNFREIHVISDDMTVRLHSDGGVSYS